MAAARQAVAHPLRLVELGRGEDLDHHLARGEPGLGGGTVPPRRRRRCRSRLRGRPRSRGRSGLIRLLDRRGIGLDLPDPLPGAAPALGERRDPDSATSSAFAAEVVEQGALVRRRRGSGVGRRLHRLPALACSDSKNSSSSSSCPSCGGVGSTSAGGRLLAICPGRGPRSRGRSRAPEKKAETRQIRRIDERDDHLAVGQRDLVVARLVGIRHVRNQLPTSVSVRGRGTRASVRSAAGRGSSSSSPPRSRSASAGTAAAA